MAKKQKTFVASSPSEIDDLVNEFSAKEGINVFASRDDTIVIPTCSGNTVSHKMTVFYNGI